MRRRKGEGFPTRWAIVGLALFLIVDVGLVAVALDARRAPQTVRASIPSPSSSAIASPTSSPQPVTSTTVVPQRVLAAVTDDVAWRGLTGSCPGNTPELEYTDDGGATWNNVDPEVRAGFSALVRVVPESTSEANVVTLDTECAPQLIGTFVAGDAWEDHSSNLGSYWYLDPMDRATVHAPDGSVPAPCGSAVSIATRSTSEAAVLCEDQAIFSTTDGGATWDTATVPGATAVAGAPDGYVVAVIGQGECPGTSVVTLLGSRVGLPTGCGGEAPAPGETAVSMAEGGTLWLWAGAFFARSTDGGLTWS